MVSIWAFQRFEFATILRIASAFQIVGMLIRDITILNDSFFPMLLGVFIQQMAAPFFLNTQVQIANRWFPDH